MSVTGYKIFDPNYKSDGYKYSLNNTNKTKKGGHTLYLSPLECLYDSEYKPENTYAQVVTGDKYTVLEDNTVVSDTLKIVKTLSYREFGELINGAFQTECIECTYKSGKLHGMYTEWYESGQLRMKVNYDNGNRHGKYSLWYPTGKLHIENNYVDGKQTGSYREWYPNGQISHEMVFVDNKLHGEYKRWYSNGRLYVEAVYVGGQKTGDYKQWHPNGNKRVECTYIQGMYHGKYKRWNDKGEQQDKFCYVFGKCK